MGGVRYAVAGSPVSHSRSPLLFEMVRAALRREGVTVDRHDVTLLECTDVAEALAWAGTRRGGRVPAEVAWSPTGERLTGRRARHGLVELARTAMETAGWGPEDDRGEVDGPEAGSLELAPWPDPGEDEVWMSLTSPLKFQLGHRASATPVDISLELGAVNQARWDGRRWWLAGTDGEGVVDVARHWGIAPEASAAALALKGGGGAARGTAAAWAAAGGRIRWLGGRRPLEADGPWAGRVHEAQTLGGLHDVLLVQFDSAPGRAAGRADLDPPPGRAVHLPPAYGAWKEAERGPPEPGGWVEVDGRWMLAAQHLAAWRRLFAPAAASLLPGLAALVAGLEAAERALAAAATSPD